MPHSTRIAVFVGFCLAAVLAGMGWLTVAALRLDAHARESQRRAWTEERVQSSLWRIDTDLSSILAEQNARPVGTFLDTPTKESATETNAGANAVAATFELDPNGKLSVGKSTQAAARWLLEPERWRDREQLVAALPAPLPWTAEPSDLAMDTLVPGDYSRASNEYVQRRYYINQNSAVATQAFNRFPAGTTRVGRMEPCWIDGWLVLLRQLDRGGQVWLQGVVFDWDALSRRLTESVADLLPGARLAPIAEAWPPGGLEPTGAAKNAIHVDASIVSEARAESTGQPSLEESSGNAITIETADPVAAADTDVGFRRLAALPARLVPGEIPLATLTGGNPALTVGPWPVSWMLATVWTAVLLALSAVAALIWGVLRLSERRAAFVGTITHELRTPLTTLRMYAEMIEGDMVSSEDRASYLTTLRREADRLSRLVENVLSYARLERRPSKPKMEDLAVGELIDHIWPRLSERASEAEVSLELEAATATRAHRIRTDPDAVEQILFNLVDNACKYSDGKPVELDVAPNGSRISFRVRDYGAGVSPEARRTLFRPFGKAATGPSASVPGVGLGLALSRRLARHLGGSLEHAELRGPGACFVLELPASASDH
jgi:signal transduction histidine kinase